MFYLFAWMNVRVVPGLSIHSIVFLFALFALYAIYFIVVVLCHNLLFCLV